MAGITTKFRRGWRDNVPPEIETVLQVHPDGQGKLAVLCVQAHALPDQSLGASDMPLYGHPLTDVDGVFNAYHVVSYFLELIVREDVDVASLLFFNFRSETFSLSERPSPLALAVVTPLEGIHAFCQSVCGSLHPREIWSLCEWAMLSCERVL